MESGDHITVEMRLAAIEEKLDLVLAHLGLAGDTGAGWLAPPAAPSGVMPTGPAWLPQPVGPQLVALVQAGKKIEAIKVYRQTTGAGLKDSKNAIDALERSLRGGGRGRS